VNGTLLNCRPYMTHPRALYTRDRREAGCMYTSSTPAKGTSIDSALFDVETIHQGHNICNRIVPTAHLQAPPVTVPITVPAAPNL